MHAAGVRRPRPRLPAQALHRAPVPEGARASPRRGRPRSVNRGPVEQRLINLLDDLGGERRLEAHRGEVLGRIHFSGRRNRLGRGRGQLRPAASAHSHLLRETMKGMEAALDHVGIRTTARRSSTPSGSRGCSRCSGECRAAETAPSSSPPAVEPAAPDARDHDGALDRRRPLRRQSQIAADGAADAARNSTNGDQVAVGSRATVEDRPQRPAPTTPRRAGREASTMA